jgi:hypothetical protein
LQEKCAFGAVQFMWLLKLFFCAFVGYEHIPTAVVHWIKPPL